MRAQLLPLEGSAAIDIGRDLTLVGRQEGCDLRLQHKSVSKLHCVIARTDGLLLVRDLGSTNGTRVNGQRVRRAALLPNDQLSIAGYKYKVFLGPDEELPVHPSERTQHLDAAEVAELLKHAKVKNNDADFHSDVAPPLQANRLPDVYPSESASSAS